MTLAGGLVKGVTRTPTDNDSAWLLDPHRRGLPNLPRMRRYGPDERVDLVIVGAGAGGVTLAQRLARAGWRIIVLERGPFWDPDRDWVSDEKGAGPIYWTDKRIIAGSDPVEMGKNNSGVGVGGSMTHFAGYVPRFHPSDFEVRTRDGVGADWPISYEDLKSSFERVERELPVAGQDWPWGDPHTYPHAPHPISGAAAVAWRGAEDCGIEMRVGPVSITNGRFGNRPHCIYRGFCLQGCKVNAKASPLITHLPDAIEHGVEVRANAMAVRVEIDESSGRATGVTYDCDGETRFAAADAVAVCGYAIETPRLLLHSTSRRFPNGLGNQHDQVGRYVMVQGATQVAARFPMDLRMYKAPPPEVSSEQFYETDERRGFARGFSIQTVSPLPIGWAEHVSAEGHWGAELREYMRDYNHWTVLGVLCELLPQAENRVTLADETDQFGMPVARFSHSLGENDRANIAFATKTMQRIWDHAGAQDTLTIDRYAHLVGGARMGTSPEESVTDADHRVWGLDNLFIVDGSVLPTQGAANPALVIMALADRCAVRLATKRVSR
ncbi:MAG TPA: GMC family oxidoreductase [Solirubrobacteraceae bacterium]|jgi:choline dehydrogenase-like flavoprotein|nr:GMC family oxidoreductase [Solirubrobacteraceae bacterium]